MPRLLDRRCPSDRPDVERDAEAAPHRSGAFGHQTTAQVTGATKIALNGPAGYALTADEALATVRLVRVANHRRILI